MSIKDKVVPQSVQPLSEFSLVLGGPFYQLLRWTHLSDDALLHIRLRVIVLSLLAWLPLLIIAELEAHKRMHSLIPYFLERNLIPEDTIPRFRAAIESTLQLRYRCFIARHRNNVCRYNNAI